MYSENQAQEVVVFELCVVELSLLDGMYYLQLIVSLVGKQNVSKFWDSLNQWSHPELLILMYRKLFLGGNRPSVARFGEHDITNEFESSSVDRQIESYKIHEEYDK